LVVLPISAILATLMVMNPNESGYAIPTDNPFEFKLSYVRAPRCSQDNPFWRFLGAVQHKKINIYIFERYTLSSCTHDITKK
jgi:hypothetical protein